jgi:hypothetical protein
VPQRRTLEAMEKDSKAADLYRRGLTYRQIAAELGWRSPNAAFEAVRRAARDAGRDSLAAAEALTMMLERLQDYRRLVYRVAVAKHYVTTQAGNVVHYDGKPVLDDAPVLQAVDRLLKTDDTEAKLLGLYAPAKSRVEVITEDVFDAEIADLAKRVAENDAAAADTSAA